MNEPFDMEAAKHNPMLVRSKDGRKARRAAFFNDGTHIAVMWTDGVSATYGPDGNYHLSHLELAPDTRTIRIRLHEGATGQGLSARTSDHDSLDNPSVMWVGPAIEVEVPAHTAPAK